MGQRLLDLSGLKCPLPALKTKRALQTLDIEEILVVITTDPLAAIDIPNAIREEGAELVDQFARPDGSMVFHAAAHGQAGPSLRRRSSGRPASG